jgi:hypothetical protein
MNYKLFFIYLLLACIILFNSSQHSTKEGFGSYTKCMEQGYPMDFCAQTPNQLDTTNEYCSCANGYFGSWHMGEGKCYCYLFNELTPDRTTRPYESSPFN